MSSTKMPIDFLFENLEYANHLMFVLNENEVLTNLIWINEFGEGYIYLPYGFNGKPRWGKLFFRELATGKVYRHYVPQFDTRSLYYDEDYVQAQDDAFFGQPSPDFSRQEVVA